LLAGNNLAPSFSFTSIPNEITSIITTEDQLLLREDGDAIGSFMLLLMVWMGEGVPKIVS
jgi:hypothetical protein